jgi:hypothetical protein
MRPVLAALLLMLFAPASAHASCATMHALAQEHANDMARRGSMDHNGFGVEHDPKMCCRRQTEQQAIALLARVWAGSQC